MGRAPTADSGAAASAEFDLEMRLLRLSYLILPLSLGKHRRARIAREALGQAPAELGAARLHLVRRALSVGPARMPLPSRAGRGQPGDALGALTPAARAAYVLVHLERMPPEQAGELLRSAGVRDPETALMMADRATLDAAAIRAVQVPAPDPARRRRFALAGVSAAVLAVGVPVVAAATGGGSDPADRVAPVSRTADATSPAGQADAVTRKAPAAKAPAAKAPAGGAAKAAKDKAAKDTQRDLDRILTRLAAALAEADADGPEAARLLDLMAAVQRQQERVRAVPPQ